ncbi:hypothetical protein EYF80_021376 [Liparis tanakae]|uniref:Uncharacterized protein n=1 Tax=Liparis tanakae TaxID=230148 RepID=A0A4Z2HT28_9TELE|nr:hypothetical protein EYF80_021376 [Liparis tanakae]
MCVYAAGIAPATPLAPKKPLTSGEAVRMRGFIWTSGNTQVSSSSSPSLIPSSSDAPEPFSSCCLTWAVFTTSMMRFLAAAEKSCLLPGYRGETKKKT